MSDLSRRALMAALAGLPLASGAYGSSMKTLVAYFSRSGNTRVVAGLIQRAMGADLFEIQPARPYPEEYLSTVALASEQRERGTEPPLQAHVSNMAAYQALYLGFPIWGESPPARIV